MKAMKAKNYAAAWKRSARLWWNSSVSHRERPEHGKGSPPTASAACSSRASGPGSGSVRAPAVRQDAAIGEGSSHRRTRRKRAAARAIFAAEQLGGCLPKSPQETSLGGGYCHPGTFGPSGIPHPWAYLSLVRSRVGDRSLLFAIFVVQPCPRLRGVLQRGGGPCLNPG